MTNWLTETLWHSRHLKHSRHSGTWTPETLKGLEHFRHLKGTWALKALGHLGARALKALGHPRHSRHFNEQSLKKRKVHPLKISEFLPSQEILNQVPSYYMHNRYLVHCAIRDITYWFKWIVQTLQFSKFLRMLLQSCKNNCLSRFVILIT